KGPRRALSKTCAGRSVEQGQVRGRNLAVAAGLELIGDLVAFIKALQARTLNGRNMHESVLFTIVGRNKAIALGGVEEFDGTVDGRHGTSSAQVRSPQ